MTSHSKLFGCRYESTENMTIQCSTKVCSFGKQVVEKVETECPRFENGRYLYKIHRSPMCEYMINFILKLKHLPEKYMMNSVLENFTILQVITNRDTQETLLCTAYVFEVSTSEHGAQHHIYRLVKDWDLWLVIVCEAVIGHFSEFSWSQSLNSWFRLIKWNCSQDYKTNSTLPWNNNRKSRTCSFIIASTEIVKIQSKESSLLNSSCYNKTLRKNFFRTTSNKEVISAQFLYFYHWTQNWWQKQIFNNQKNCRKDSAQHLSTNNSKNMEILRFNSGWCLQNTR